MKRENRRVLKGLGCLFGLLLTFALAAGCGAKKEEELVPDESVKEKTPLIGLILTSTDAPENDALVADFETMAEEAGAELMVLYPDVTSIEAEEARAMTGDFILYDVNPIEYQMLHVNELVEADADVIAIYANHPQRLESVLTAAKGVGIQVCAIEQEIGEESFDVYADLDEAADAVKELIE